MLFLNNDDVRSVLTMEMTIAALKQAYREIMDGEGVCRPRVDLHRRDEAGLGGRGRAHARGRGRLQG